MLTPPRSRDGVKDDAETGAKFLEDVRRQSFGHHISELLASGNMENTYVAESHSFADEVDVQFHMLSAVVVNRVHRQVHGRDIVAVDEHGAADRT
jgi:nucleoside-triphosphatase THEP1